MEREIEIWHEEVGTLIFDCDLELEYSGFDHEFGHEKGGYYYIIENFKLATCEDCTINEAKDFIEKNYDLVFDLISEEVKNIEIPINEPDYD